MGTKRQSRHAAKQLSDDEIQYLSSGLDHEGGKLPLFDLRGQVIDPKIIHACLDKGFARPWFANPLKPDWMICRLTEAGRHAVDQV